MSTKPSGPRRNKMPNGKSRPLKKEPALSLSAQAQTLNQILIACIIAVFHIIEKTATLADQFQQTAARVIILRMGFEMLSQIGNAFRQNGHLDFGRTCVAVTCGIFFNQRSFALKRYRHHSLLRDIRPVLEIENTPRLYKPVLFIHSGNGQSLPAMGEQHMTRNFRVRR